MLILKEMKRIVLPQRVCSDSNGYSFFAEMHESISSAFSETIIIDFSLNGWFEANLSAILGSLLSKAQENFNNILFEKLPLKQREILSRNHFLASFGGEKLDDYNNTTIKYRRNRLTDDKLIHHFLSSDLLGKEEFPKLSSAAHKEIERSIFEIFSNAIIHGNCEFVYSCGQYFPRKTPPRIDFTIVDLGNTIKYNTNNFLKAKLSGKEAIEWAVVENHTTKPKEGNIPGGLGLKIISEFVKLNKGKLQIVSSDGFWELNKGVQISDSMKYEFPGTIVNIEFNLDDASFYYLTVEDIEDIKF